MCTAALLISCELFDYHPYDTRVNGKHNINAQNIQRIEKDCHGKETITFAVISDTQRWYDETNDAVKSINAHDSVDFVIHCGDISDFGVTKEFTIQRDMLEKLNVPYPNFNISSLKNPCNSAYSIFAHTLWVLQIFQIR